jgi:ABC-type multidrug transport system fused ATPase/permease subunit
MPGHPIRLVVRDDLRRSRLTVFFRLLLAIPHFIWLLLWSVAVFFVAILSWFIVLFTGRLPEGLHAFSSAYVRYATHVYGYVLLAANPFPGFTGTAGSYPLDPEIDAPARQSRWKTAFRLLLAIPALFITAVLVNGYGGGGSGDSAGNTGSEETYYWGGAAGLAVTIAFFAWFACLVRARMPNGFRDALAYSLRYAAQTSGYLLFLTDRYPDADPVEPPPSPPVPRPVALASEDDLRRSRLTVFFRLLLAIPLVVWLLLWAIAVFFAIVIAWFAGIVLGRVPAALHRFIAAFLRYSIHVNAFVMLVANPFPGFVGRYGTYPVDLRVDPPAPQRRWTILLRFFLAIPALFVESVLATSLLFVAFFGWFVSLALGRMPGGLQGLGAYALGYYGQVYGYVWLLTGTYPYSGPPAVVTEPEPEPEPEPAWPAAPPSPSF